MYFRGIRGDYHALGDRSGARGDKFAETLYMYQAQPASAESGKLGMITESGNVDFLTLRRLQDGFSRLNLYWNSVDAYFNFGSALYCFHFLVYWLCLAHSGGTFLIFDMCFEIAAKISDKTSDRTGSGNTERAIGTLSKLAGQIHQIRQEIDL